MAKVRKCLLGSMWSFYLMRMISGLHPKSLQVLLILVSPLFKLVHSDWTLTLAGTEHQVLMMEKIVARLKSRHGYYNPDAYPNPCKLPSSVTHDLATADPQH